MDDPEITSELVNWAVLELVELLFLVFVSFTTVLSDEML